MRIASLANRNLSHDLTAPQSPLTRKKSALAAPVGRVTIGFGQRFSSVLRTETASAAVDLSSPHDLIRFPVVMPPLPAPGALPAIVPACHS